MRYIRNERGEREEQIRKRQNKYTNERGGARPAGDTENGE